MLNKIFIFLACFFAILAVCLFFWVNIQGKRIDSLKTAKNTLEANNNLLLTRLEREHNDKVELGRKIDKLQALAKTDSDFDWSRDISNSLIVGWLRENAIQVQGSRKRAD